MKLSTRARYGLRAIVEIGLNNGKPMLLKDISKKIGVSMKYLDHIFSSLKKSGIIKNLKSHGGYVLSKKPENITALEVVKVLDGEISVVDCISSNVCEKIGRCVANELWKEINKAIEEILRINLKDLILRQRKLNSKKVKIYYI